VQTSKAFGGACKKTSRKKEFRSDPKLKMKRPQREGGCIGDMRKKKRETKGAADQLTCSAFQPNKATKRIALGGAGKQLKCTGVKEREKREQNRTTSEVKQKVW